MKKISRVLSLVLVLTMVLALGAVTAFAATSTTGSLTITDSRTGRTYDAYQIVYGDVTGTEGSATAPLTLTNVKWGNGQTTHTAGTALTADELKALPGATADRTAINKYISDLDLATSTPYQSTAVSGEYRFTDLPAGWYFVVETTETDGKDDFKSAFIVEVVGDATAEPKGSKTTVEKKVDDINDSEPTGTSKNWIEKDSADYDIGDDIVFTLKATIGNDLTDYTKYELVFTDNLSKGLTYKELVSVSVDGKQKENSIVKVGDGVYTASDAYADGSVKTFTIENILAETVGAKAGNTIVIKYKATLNENAVIGSAGNPNKVYLEYSNNPANNGKGKTGEDFNKVFTYKLTVDKVDQDGEDLTGADFTLYKEVPAGTTGALTGSKIKEAYTNASIEASALDDAKSYIVVAHQNNPGARFEFNGIDDGNYVLVETTIPEGKNAWTSAAFTVAATHDEEEADPQLLTLTAGSPFTTDNKEAGSVSRTKDGTTYSRASGEGYAEIVNESGTVLPSTGGMGTTIFYIVGGILVAAAAVLLITRRRMAAK